MCVISDRRESGTYSDVCVDPGLAKVVLPGTRRLMTIIAESQWRCDTVPIPEKRKYSVSLDVALPVLSNVNIFISYISRERETLLPDPPSILTPTPPAKTRKTSLKPF